MRVQRVARRYGVFVALVEIAALIALVAALLIAPTGSTQMWLVGAAALCVAAMLGVWASLLRPLNITIAGWLPETVPADWPHHHARWTTFRRLRVVLAVIALALLLVGLLAQPAH
jgi:uncharacterized membrane protein